MVPHHNQLVLWQRLSSVEHQLNYISEVAVRKKGKQNVLIVA